MIETRIFKVQRPMATSDEEGYNQLLIYDEDRDIDQIWNASKKEMKQLFPNDEYKTYWEGGGRHREKTVLAHQTSGGTAVVKIKNFLINYNIDRGITM